MEFSSKSTMIFEPEQNSLYRPKRMSHPSDNCHNYFFYCINYFFVHNCWLLTGCDFVRVSYHLVSILPIPEVNILSIVSFIAHCYTYARQTAAATWFSMHYGCFIQFSFTFVSVTNQSCCVCCCCTTRCS